MNGERNGIPAYNKTDVVYIWDEHLIRECDRLPQFINRASMVHGLIEAYGLLDKMTVCPSTPATYEELKEFHSPLYLDHVIQNLRGIDEDYETNQDDEDLGLGYDCQPLDRMYELMQALAGGSLAAAEALIRAPAAVAINWCGGWHHAQRFEAEGFCYVNDIVLAIERLRKIYKKVLYIDLDIHHGNGVENAYSACKSVFTLSLHKCGPGFYPGSGTICDIGQLYGRGYSCNFPFKDGVSGRTLCKAFHRIFPLVMAVFEPKAIVVQCGADCLTGDPLGSANVTPAAVWECIKEVLDRRKPTLLLGGGGYNFTNTARLWTYITGKVVNEELSDEIPDNEYFLSYGPGYELAIEEGARKDYNDDAYIEQCIETITGNIGKYLHREKQMMKPIN